MPQKPKDRINLTPLNTLNLDLIEMALTKKKRFRLNNWFPDEGPFRRELYPKHMEFFAASKIHNEVLMLAANRVGKTICGSLALTYHATGLYPDWWEGKVFDSPILGWACNKTATDCRDINQLELLGPHGQYGTGMIPADYLIHVKPKPSVPDGIEIIYVKHVTGGQSVLFLKSYDQGREKYQGRAVHVIWADEEVPVEIYTEMLLRTMTTDGIILCTYTPILGLTPVTIDFLTNAVNKDKLPIKFTIAKDHSGRLPDMTDIMKEVGK